MNSVRVLRYGFLVGLQDFAIQWSFYTWLGGYALRVVTQGIFFALLAKLVAAPDYVHYMIVGQAIVVGATNVGWAMSGPSSDRWDGTYPLLVVAPSSMLPPLVGRTFIWVISGVAASLIAFVVLFLAFGETPPWPEVLALPFLVALTCLGGYATSLFLGGLLTLKPRLNTLAINLLSTGLIAFCGVSVPVDYWPGWIQIIVNALPVTHGIEAIRVLLDEGPAGDVWRETGYLVGGAVVWLLLSVLLLDWLTDRGRADGSIEFVA